MIINLLVTLFALISLSTIPTAILYVTGWRLIWGVTQFSSQPLIINFSDNIILIRFNDLYYGTALIPRFFDSPFISNIALSAAIVMEAIIISSSLKSKGKNKSPASTLENTQATK